MLKIVAIKQKTVSNSWKSSIYPDSSCRPLTLYNTIHIQEYKRWSNKNEVKDSNSSNASLFTSALFRIQQPSSCERHTQMGVTLVTKFGRALGATVVFFCRLCTNPSGYKLGGRKSRSTLE